MKYNEFHTDKRFLVSHIIGNLDKDAILSQFSCFHFALYPDNSNDGRRVLLLAILKNRPGFSPV